MKPGARTPEELETLLEDAFVVRDRAAVGELFEEGALLMAAGGAREARGPRQITRTAVAMWESDRTFVADPAQVLQCRDTALVLAQHGTSVMRRGRDGAWRYVIAVLSGNTNMTSDEGEPMTESTQAQPVTAPVAVGADEGEARWWFGALAVIKATAADTGGVMSIVEVTEPPGAEAPLHVHHREDEAFWILEGDVTLYVGDTTIEAQAGDYAFGPRDVPHRYTVGAAGCRMLFICTPGGFDELVVAMSEPAGSRTLPPPPEGEPDMERMMAVAAAHGCELLMG